jgi:hypothetical protein
LATTPNVFFTWLRTPLHLRLNEVLDGYAVLADEPKWNLTSPDGFVVDSEGLRKEPRLLTGLPHNPRKEDSNGAVTLDGQITITGAWPAAANAASQAMTEGCMGCWENYRWQGKRWVHVGGAKFQPDWWTPPNPRPRSVEFPNGTTLWEKFVSSGADLAKGKSTFFNDPHGRVRSKRQRLIGPSSCSGNTQLVGEFSGVGLGDGSLLGIGLDCATGIVSAELWQQGAVTSKLVELPGQPRSLAFRSVYSDPVQYGVRSERDVAIAFGQQGSDGDGLEQPYIALFDGTDFHSLAFPIQGLLREILRPQDGSVWILFETSVWRHPGLSNLTAPFVQICADLSLEDSWELIPRPNSDPWIRSTRQIISIDQGTCRGLSLPAIDDKVNEEHYLPYDLKFLRNGDPVVLASGGTDNVLLLTKPTSTIINQ